MIEPGQPYVHGWHIDAICEHLEAITAGEITRLVINVPPGCMKSLLLNVFWPAWEWTKRPELRFLCAAHSQALSVRDSTKMRRLIVSEWYQARWGDVVTLTDDQATKLKFENTKTGFREAVAAGSITGARGDRVIIDDPNSVESAASEQMRASTNEWFLEAVPTRLNNPALSAIVVIQQRLHTDDVTGVILSKNLGYDHLMLPMEFDETRRCITRIGFIDPRTEDGELLFPERFPAAVVERDKRVMGPYATAGQFQQSPVPRGGAILRRDWWRLWDEDACRQHGVEPGLFPHCELVVASLDTAYTSKKESDFSALCIFGVWRDRNDVPQLMLMNAWTKRLDLHTPHIDKQVDETQASYEARTKEHWGLVEWVAHSCKRFGVDVLLIEKTALGSPTEGELKRLHRHSGFSIRQVVPSGDKVARAYAAQAPFADGQIWAPDRAYAELAIEQCEVFPRGKNDDLVDAITQCVSWCKSNGLLIRNEDIQVETERALTHVGQVRPLYEV